MRTLLHLSDLHFGRVDASLLEPVVDFTRQLAPDCVVVSGDLTQRARSAEFTQAREFLDRLAAPQVVVPGNHDVPMTNPLARFASPFEKWRRFIGAELEPEFVDDEVAVVGLNSARSLAIKGGRISRAQVARLRDRLCTLDASLVKVVVSHHPFDLPGSPGRGDVIGRALLGLKMFAGCGADLLLAGHMHVGLSQSTEIQGENGAYSAVVAQAGTATSTRGRGQANSFNVIRIDANEIRIEPVLWVAGEKVFRAQAPERFVYGEQGWARVDSPKPGEIATATRTR